MKYVVCILCEEYKAELASDTHRLPTCHACRERYPAGYIARCVAFVIGNLANFPKPRRVKIAAEHREGSPIGVA